MITPEAQRNLLIQVNVEQSPDPDVNFRLNRFHSMAVVSGRCVGKNLQSRRPQITRVFLDMIIASPLRCTRWLALIQRQM